MHLSRADGEMKNKYKIELHKCCKKDIKKIPRKVQNQIKDSIRELSIDPRPLNCVKMKGDNSLYRIRCGDYRVVYSIEDHVLLVLVIEIGHRSEIYRKQPRLLDTSAFIPSESF